MKTGAQSGFTVIELLVVISIMAIMSGIVLADYPQFNRLTSLERGAQLMALTMRESETRAMSARGSAGVFTNRFGMHVDISSTGNPRQYILFADTGGAANFYDLGEELFIHTLSPQVRINKICRLLRDANPVTGECLYERLSITFERPAPVISVYGAIGGNPPDDLGTGDFEIELITVDGSLLRCVAVWSTGAISIESNPC